MKRMIILVSLFFTIFIIGCEQQNEKASDSDKPSTQTDKTTTQADKPSSKLVTVTVKVVDKDYGNLIPNVLYQWDGLKIKKPADQDGILKRNFPPNTKHQIRVWKQSVVGEVTKTFKVPDHPITVEVFFREITNKNAFVEGYVSKKLSKRGFLLDVTKGHLGFDKGELINVGVDDEKMLENLEEGKYVKVWYSGKFESAPPQTVGLKVEIKDSKK